MTRDAFNVIIHRLNRKLFAIAFRIVKNRQEAEDVVQEVFMKMWMMREKLDDYNDTEALAVTMTRNNCIDQLRKWKHIDSEKEAADIRNPDYSPSPHERLVNSETADILAGIIDELPPATRDLVQLREINGLSYDEISKQKEMNINNLRVVLSRARKIIKEKYIKYTNEKGRA
jgi:RNA polymerase sigma factor (sigma-70 family)